MAEICFGSSREGSRVMTMIKINNNDDNKSDYNDNNNKKDTK